MDGSDALSVYPFAVGIRCLVSPQVFSSASDEPLALNRRSPRIDCCACSYHTRPPKNTDSCDIGFQTTSFRVDKEAGSWDTVHRQRTIPRSRL